MNTVMVHEASEVCGKGVIALPVHAGKPYGRLESTPKRSRLYNGQLRLSSGKEMPWTPAANIGWN